MSMAQGGAEMGGSLGGMIALGVGALTGWGKPKGVSRKRTASYVGNTFMGSSAGGLKLYFDEERARREGVGFTVESSPERKALVSGISDAYRNAAADYRGLRDEVSPGFGRLTEDSVRAIRDAETRGRSDLTQAFAKRRLAGSSFAADKSTQLALEAGQQERAARSESFLQELQLTVDLIGRETANEVAAFTTSLNEMNLQASLVNNIVGQMANVTSQFNAAMTQLGVDYQQQMYKLYTWAAVTGGAGAGRMGGAAADAYLGSMGGMGGMGGGGGSSVQPPA